MVVRDRRSACAQIGSCRLATGPFLFGENLIECGCMETTLFGAKYRIKAARIPNWNYASPGFYYVTICTRSRMECFGNITDGKMNLSPIGVAADECWRAIPAHFPHVVLDEYVVMPNHVHGVARITKSRHDNVIVETQNFAFLQYVKRFGPQSRNLASIIRGFKIGVTKWARQNDFADFAWQPRYHDHVVRDENDLDRVRGYIRANPEKWDRDRNNFGNEFKIL